MEQIQELWILASIDGILAGFCVENFMATLIIILRYVCLFFISYVFYPFLKLVGFLRFEKGGQMGMLLMQKLLMVLQRSCLLCRLFFNFCSECAGYYYLNLIKIVPGTPFKCVRSVRERVVVHCLSSIY